DNNKIEIKSDFNKNLFSITGNSLYNYSSSNNILLTDKDGQDLMSAKYSFDQLASNNWSLNNTNINYGFNQNTNEKWEFTSSTVTSNISNMTSLSGALNINNLTSDYSAMLEYKQQYSDYFKLGEYSESNMFSSSYNFSLANNDGNIITNNEWLRSRGNEVFTAELNSNIKFGDINSANLDWNASYVNSDDLTEIKLNTSGTIGTKSQNRVSVESTTTFKNIFGNNTNGEVGINYQYSSDKKDTANINAKLSSNYSPNEFTDLKFSANGELQLYQPSQSNIHINSEAIFKNVFGNKHITANLGGEYTITNKQSNYNLFGNLSYQRGNLNSDIGVTVNNNSQSIKWELGYIEGNKNSNVNFNIFTEYANPRNQFNNQDKGFRFGAGLKIDF
ncbi:hypothetical protein, partial [Wohlfahrtiimonas populi]|uniref:hypothetical protein n=1 Tax=Wohlfahrtiimonas populi TaxID=1940240 RepID=UPI001300CC61